MIMCVIVIAVMHPIAAAVSLVVQYLQEWPALIVWLAVLLPITRAYNVWLLHLYLWRIVERHALVRVVPPVPQSGILAPTVRHGTGHLNRSRRARVLQYHPLIVWVPRVQAEVGGIACQGRSLKWLAGTIPRVAVIAQSKHGAHYMQNLMDCFFAPRP